MSITPQLPGPNPWPAPPRQQPPPPAGWYWANETCLHRTYSQELEALVQQVAWPSPVAGTWFFRLEMNGLPPLRLRPAFYASAERAAEACDRFVADRKLA